MAFRKGDAVEIERDGEWNAGRIVDVLDDGNYRVSFDPLEGYEDLEDEDVEPDRVRSAEKKAAAPA